jgi:hypothetical protein
MLLLYDEPLSTPSQLPSWSMISLWTLRDSVRYVRSCSPLPFPRLDNLDPLQLSARLFPEISELCLLTEERNSDQNPQQILVLMRFWSPRRCGAGEGFRYATVPTIFGGRRHFRRQDATHHVVREPVNFGRGKEVTFICECQVCEYTYKVNMWHFHCLLLNYNYFY